MTNREAIVSIAQTLICLQMHRDGQQTPDWGSVTIYVDRAAKLLANDEGKHDAAIELWRRYNVAA